MGRSLWKMLHLQQTSLLPRGCPSLAPSSVHKACVQRCHQQALKPASDIPFNTHLVQAFLFSTFSCSQINFLLNRKIQSNRNPRARGGGMAAERPSVFQKDASRRRKSPCRPPSAPSALAAHARLGKMRRDPNLHGLPQRERDSLTTKGSSHSKEQSNTSTPGVA